MQRFRRISATNQTLRAQLFTSEEVLEQQDGVGLYDGKDKDEAHGDGRLVLTTHRVVYLDSTDPHRRSCSLDLHLIRQTEYWAGFLKSSAKITLLLGDPPSASSASATSPPPPGGGTIEPPTRQEADQAIEYLHPGASSWTCHICGFSNAPRPECGLCGVKRDVEAGTRAASAGTRTVTNGVGGINLGAGVGGPRRPSPQADEAPAVEVTVVKGKGAGIPCPTCTFLNHPSMFRCEMCDSPLGASSSSPPSPSLIKPTPTRATRSGSAPLAGSTSSPSHPRTGVLSDPSTPSHSRATTPAPPSNFPPNAYVRLSFRRGGDKTFYTALKKALFARGWDHSGSGSAAVAGGLLASNAEPARLRVIGIDGILRTMDWKEQARQGEMEEGLRDLQGLMARAKEMVQMAQSLNAKLTAQQSSPDSPEPSSSSATVIRSSLVSLGLALDGPAVTADMIASDLSYEHELARELGGLLTGVGTGNGRGGKRRRAVMSDGPPSEEEDGTRGLIGLDEVWCIWNRSRGVSLLSPSALLSAARHLPSYTFPPISLHTFISGRLALATPLYSTRSFGDRLLRMLAGPERRGQGVGVIEVAKEERIGIGLAREMCEAVEMDPEGGAGIVRDEQVAGFGGATGQGNVRWWRNEMAGYRWEDRNVDKQAAVTLA